MDFWKSTGKLLAGTARLAGKATVATGKLAAKGAMAAGKVVYDNRKEIGQVAAKTAKVVGTAVGVVGYGSAQAATFHSHGSWSASRTFPRRDAKS